ncbi:polyprenyl synthetase family protein [Gammaproteobacteria bacterium]|nr:polyprenyl synthetase family protein [Gammaproteobacteria bacterium]
MLENFLSQTREQVSQSIKKSIGNSNLIEEAMSYSALADSKMIRAALINASGKVNKKISDSSLLTFATGVELIHTYSLIHDDLPSMDDDDLRRGKDSSHIKFGEANAILAGDALQSLAYEIICNESSLEDKHKIEAIKMISKACGKNGMVYGQYLDINAETKKINEQAIKNIHTLKTGKLIECSVMLGQIGNEDLEEKNQMRSFGDKIGLAFQITDDILEVTSNKETLGKNINSDLKNCKATYINILGLDESIKKSKDLCESAINELKSIKSDEIDLLIELAKYICYREK